MADFSLVICTYNPAISILKRCLDAVDQLQTASSFETEIIVVDNNSAPALEELEYVLRFLGSGPSRFILRENRPGLTFARLAGFAAARGEAVVYVDDDAVLPVDYLTKAAELLTNYPTVGVWGPGIIEVEWEEGTPRWVKGYASVFQAKRRTRCEFGSVVGWPDYYPAGTGMVVRRAVLSRYKEQVDQHQLTAIDRCGRRLTSGGDAQIVWTAVSMGLSAGSSPSLQLRHLIARRKAKPPYICRMVFGVMASGQLAMTECFPEIKRDLRKTLPSTMGSYALILGEVLKVLLRLRLRSGIVSIASLAGELHGRFLAAGRRSPLLTRLAAQLLSFD